MASLGCHDRFGELAALAAVGQLSAKEDRELRQHLTVCADCRGEYQEFADIVHGDIPMLHDRLISTPIAGDSRRAGILETSVATEKSMRPPAFVPWDVIAGNMRRIATVVPAYALTLVVVLSVAAMALALWVRADRGERGRRAELAELSTENAELRARLSNANGTPHLQAQSPKTPAEALGSSTSSSLPSGDIALLSKNRNLEKQLSSATSDAAKLRAELAEKQSANAALSTRLSETESRLSEKDAGFSQMKDELESQQSARSQDLAKIGQQDGRLRELQSELDSALEAASQDEQLLLHDKDIRDLMGARNLRIIDVYDVFGKGKTGASFGRMFFTEGKSLLFYAFDLDGARPQMKNAVYQVWGFDAPHKDAARKLGIFFQDDAKANRWFMKFNNPNVLNEIDSVFVTVEPSGGSKHPTGTRFLAAYLKSDLNHP